MRSERGGAAAPFFVVFVLIRQVVVVCKAVGTTKTGVSDMKHGRSTVAVLGLAAALVAGPAAAQSADPSGIYLGGSLGRSQYKDTCKNLFIPCEDQDTAWRFFGG